MKVRLPRQQFQEALAAISSVTGTRTPKPILNCVKITATRDAVLLQGTDGEAALSIEVPVVLTDRTGETVVSSDRVFSIVRESSDVEVQLEASAQQAVLRGEGSEFKIFVHDPSDFPPVPEFEGQPDLVVDGHGLRRASLLTLYAAAKETTRYAINGVLWQKRGKTMFLVATDGRRLARAAAPLVKADAGDFETIVPARAMGIFERACPAPSGDDEWKIDVRVMPNQLLIRSGSAVLATALLEGKFPDYDAVIPRDQDKTARIEKNLFYSAVRRAALLTTDEARAVRLEFNDNRLTLSSRAPEQGEARIELPVDFDGKSTAIGFNPAYLSDALRVVDFEQVVLKMSQPDKPGVLRGEDANDYLYVIMPVAL